MRTTAGMQRITVDSCFEDHPSCGIGSRAAILAWSMIENVYPLNVRSGEEHHEETNITLDFFLHFEYLSERGEIYGIVDNSLEII